LSKSKIYYFYIATPNVVQELYSSVRVQEFWNAQELPDWAANSGKT
jgi:hypothetical protein